MVGKGGVGKSTTAAGVALALAGQGVSVHLISVDPAHSIGDVLRDSAGPLPSSSRCSDRLTLEELDAGAVVSRRFGPLEPALRELVDRGTYLDEADAGLLLDATIPGLDEIGAALRIPELAGGRLVVDTAPTGHTLRLLDIPATLRAWAGAFEAMATKADTVASALLGRPVTLQGKAALDVLIDQADRFRAVVRGADFLVLTGPGRVVAAETRRLVAALEARELRVVATVAPARPGAEADILVPFRPGLAGCRALRSWASAEARTPDGAGDRSGSDPQPAAATPPRPTGVLRGRAGLPPELDRQLLVFAGKGGVGKSTCAAAAAATRAASVRVALVGLDPAGSLGDLLPDPPPRLDVEEMDAERELGDLKRLYRQEVEQVFAGLGLDRSARLDRAVVESFWELAPPGLDELMAVARLAADEAGERALVLDTAPTGHFLRLVSMPELALDWTHRMLRILLKYRALAGLDAPAEHLLRLAKRLRRLRERLADPSRTALVLVTLEDPVVHAETSRLAQRMGDLGMRPAALLVNRATDPARTLDLPTFAAPEVPEPVGAVALRDFAARWRRVT